MPVSGKLSEGACQPLNPGHAPATEADRQYNKELPVGASNFDDVGSFPSTLLAKAICMYAVYHGVPGLSAVAAGTPLIGMHQQADATAEMVNACQ